MRPVGGHVPAGALLAPRAGPTLGTGARPVDGAALPAVLALAVAAVAAVLIVVLVRRSNARHARTAIELDEVN